MPTIAGWRASLLDDGADGSRPTVVANTWWPLCRLGLSLSRGRRLPVNVAISFALLAAAACARPTDDRVRVATTTSVQNSGLMAFLQPAFKEDSGLELLIHSTGSGRALRLLETGEVEVVISHAPETEQRLLPQHPEWSYRKFAYNRFTVVGPPDDPAGIRNSSDVLDAFRRIADSTAIFVSRGDESGTHEREQAFWRAAGRRPQSNSFIVSGRGMAQALRHADQAEAYTLSDEPTFWQLRHELQLVPLFATDERLLNTYAVIALESSDVARAFEQWLVSARGRERLGAFTIDGKQAYETWPEGCPAENPAALLCQPH